MGLPHCKLFFGTSEEAGATGTDPIFGPDQDTISYTYMIPICMHQKQGENGKRHFAKKYLTHLQESQDLSWISSLLFTGPCPPCLLPEGSWFLVLGGYLLTLCSTMQPQKHRVDPITRKMGYSNDPGTLFPYKITTIWTF